MILKIYFGHYDFSVTVSFKLLRFFIEKFSEDLQKKYKKYISLKESGMDNIAIVEKLPTKYIPLTHFLVEE